MKKFWPLVFLGLSGCTTANDVALRQAQASIESAREGQILAAGLAGSANWSGMAVFALVLTLCSLALMIAFRLGRAVNTRQVEHRAAEARPAERRPMVQRSQQIVFLTREERSLIAELRRRRSYLPEPAEEDAPVVIYEDDEVDLWR